MRRDYWWLLVQCMRLPALDPVRLQAFPVLLSRVAGRDVANDVALSPRLLRLRLVSRFSVGGESCGHAGGYLLADYVPKHIA